MANSRCIHQLSVLRSPKKSIKPAQLSALRVFSCPAESSIGAGSHSTLDPALIFHNQLLRRIVARIINRYPSPPVFGGFKLCRGQDSGLCASKAGDANISTASIHPWCICCRLDVQSFQAIPRHVSEQRVGFLNRHFENQLCFRPRIILQLGASRVGYTIGAGGQKHCEKGNCDDVFHFIEIVDLLPFNHRC